MENCRYTEVINLRFPHCGIASLAQVSTMGLCPLLLNGNEVKTIVMQENNIQMAAEHRSFTSFQMVHTHTHHLSHFVTHHISNLSHAIFHTQLCHTLSFTHNFVTHHFVTRHLSHTILDTPSFTPLCHTPSFTPHFCPTPLCHNHSSHTTLSHTIFHHTIFHTQLCRTPSFTTLSFTRNFVAHHLPPHHLSHTTLPHTIFHTQLCHPPSLTHHLSHTTLSHSPSVFVTHHLSHTMTYNFVTHNFVLLLGLPPPPLLSLLAEVVLWGYPVL